MRLSCFVWLRVKGSWLFPSVLSLLNGEMKTALLKATNLYPVRSDFKGTLHIYVGCFELLTWSLSVYYVSPCLPPAMSAGFWDVLLLVCISSLWQATVIRAAELKGCFQTHTHPRPHRHLSLKTQTASRSILLLRSSSLPPSLNPLPIPAKEMLTFEELSVESIYIGLYTL